MIINYKLGHKSDGKILAMSTSLGNLGGSNMYCDHQRLHNEKLDMYCENGMLFNAKAAKFGVISNEFKFYGYCTEKAIQNKIKKEEYQSCSTHMLKSKVEKIKEDLMKNCH